MEDASFKDDFLVESYENLNDIFDGLTKLEKNPKNDQLINLVYRAVHTLKGSAGFLGFSVLENLTHSCENLLDLIRDKKLKVNSDVIDSLLSAFDLCKHIITQIEEKGVEGPVQIDDVIKKLEKASSTHEITFELIQGDMKEFTEKTKSQNDLLSLDENLMDEFHYMVEHSLLSEQEEVSSPHSFKNETLSSSKAKSNSVRVNVSTLDKIMNTVGELVLNRNQLMQYANFYQKPSLQKLTHELGNITSLLQSEVMNTRMQPIGSILNQFERVVRDISKQEDKLIRLELFGQETELDRTLIEAIKDPLMHIVRNACDHGIESESERVASGKLRQATLKIRAYNERGQVTIDVTDDGRGIDPFRIADTAIQKGLVTEEKASSMSEQQILDLIFEPGFSTASSVTHISGRGVGMDVVRANIQKIGGSVSFDTSLGSGTEFKLRIPLTLAIIPVLLFKSKNELFSIPQLNLLELVRLETELEKKRLELIHGSHFYRLRGELIPLFDFNETLNLESLSEKSKKINSIAETNFQSEFDYKKIDRLSNTGDEINIIILNGNGNVFGIIVDEILDTEEIVVKPLNKFLSQMKIYGGATIMGDGKVSLILDTYGYYQAVCNHYKNSIHSVYLSHNKKKDSLLTENEKEEQEYLLFKLNDNNIYGVPVNFILRLEEFDGKDLEVNGNQVFVRYMDRALPLVNLNRILKKETRSPLELSSDLSRLKIPCIIIKVGDYIFGLPVEKILDISQCEVDMNSMGVGGEGLLGHYYVKDQKVSLLDLYCIIDYLKASQSYRFQSDELIKHQNKSVLLIESSMLYRKMIMQTLKDSGYQVETSKSGYEGFEKSNLYNFDIILTDLEMPDMNAYEFASKIRNDGQYKKTKIIALSTSLNSIDLQKAQTVGINQHIQKFNKDEILKTLDSILVEE